MKETEKHCTRTEQLVHTFLMILPISKEEKNNICIAARLHDIGKEKIPKEILNKPGRLTEAEFDIMKCHATYGKEMLKGILSEEICDIILYHHENEDGSGYYHICAEDIPLGAKIIHICDVYDALIHDRCYKKAWKKEDAIQYIRENEGTIFEKELAEDFCRMQQKREKQ